jgi:hypothetical protein
LDYALDFVVFGKCSNKNVADVFLADDDYAGVFFSIVRLKILLCRDD